MRPGSYICKLCSRFPDTEFRIFKDGDTTNPVNPKSLPQLQIGQFHNGEEVKVEVEGTSEKLAAAFFKLAWENLGNYADDVVAGKARLDAMIDEAFLHLEDPTLERIDASTIQKAPEECRSVAVINDRLHLVPVDYLPRISELFGIEAEIAFDEPQSGIQFFDITDEKRFDIDRLLSMRVDVGTRVTIVTSGKERFKANNAIKSVLENLWQCDEWLRSRRLGANEGKTTKELIDFAGKLTRAASVEFALIRNPLVSNLLTEQHIFVNQPSSKFTKEDVMNQLVAPHARFYGLDVSLVLKCLEERERDESVILREGFAIAHASLERTPRISLSLGVYPKGVLWNEKQNSVNLVVMVLFAEDTYGTYRDYFRKLAMIFRTKPKLQQELTRTADAMEFLRKLREAELSLDHR